MSWTSCRLCGRAELSCAVFLVCWAFVLGAPSCPSTSQERETLVGTADRLMSIGDLHAALACGERLAALYPNEAVGFEVLAKVCFLGGDNACCIRFSERSSSLFAHGSPERARAQVRLANCFAATENWSKALSSYQDATSCSKLFSEELATAYNNLGNVFRMMERNTDAIDNYMSAASFAPSFADAYFNAGGLLVEAGRVAEGTEALRTAVGLEAAGVENWKALAGALEGAGDGDAPRALRTVLLLLEEERRERGGSDWGGKEMLLWARSLVRGGDVQAGVLVAKRALSRLQRGASRAAEELVWAARVAGEVAGAGEKRVAQAMLDMLRALPDVTGGELRSLAAVYAGNEMRDYDSASVLLRAAWEQGAEGALPALLSALQTTCDWGDGEALVERARGGGWEGVGPYEALYLGVSAWELLSIAEAAAAPLNSRAGAATSLHGASDSWWRGAGSLPLAGAGGMRVGFLSSDMKLSHPVGQLLLPVLRALADSSMQAVCIDSHWRGRGRSSAAWEADLEAACGGGMERGGRWGAREGGARLNALRLHVLINLNGWAGEDRHEWMVAAPAPLQVNALGYPGTSGCVFVDLLLSDATSSPPELAAAFSERLLLLPPSHHPFPHRDSFGVAPPAAPLSRMEVGLPAEEEDKVVVACFNRLKKLDRRTWDSWLAVLLASPRAVLWLSRLALSPRAEDRLLASAAAAGLAAERIVLSSPFPSQRHLATKSHASLLLDTPRYNGHVSAGDALWAAVPMVVLPLETPASRLSASLAASSRGVFVARSPEDYVALALALLRVPALRARAQAALERERAEGDLFDTRLWARRLHRALRMALDVEASRGWEGGGRPAEGRRPLMHVSVAADAR